VIVLAAAHHLLGARLVARAGLGGQRGNVAIRRIDDQRAAALAIDDGHAFAGIEPEIVIAADVAGGARRTVASLRRRGAIRIARLVEAIAPIDGGLLHARGGFLTEHEIRDALRPLERRDRGVGPRARQIGGRRGRACGFAVAGLACCARHRRQAAARTNATSVLGSSHVVLY
jgi:hypothetical protein